jgi:hypothetical protein
VAKVKVWNDNFLPFEQRFKGEKIRIEANSFIEMEHDDAVQFKSYPHAMKFDGMNQQDPSSFKKIRIDGRPVATDDKVVAYRCQRDGTLHPSKEALEAHIASLGDDAFADDEGKKIARAKRAKTAVNEG